MSNYYTLTDESITLQDFINVTVHHYRVGLDPSIQARVEKNRQYVEDLVQSGTIAYGLTTGFGALKDKIIDPANTKQLQDNLIQSHAVGTGDPVPPHIVRGMMLLRLRSFCYGCSGVRYYVLEKLVECLNKNFIPMVPSQGSVGASGDLCPLSHMVVSMMGQGKALVYNWKTTGSNKYVQSADVLAR